MKVLVLNCGSSSLKYQLINMETEEVLASGKYERIGEDEAFITHKVNGQKIEIQHPAKTHEEAVDFTLKQLINPDYKVIDSLDENGYLKDEDLVIKDLNIDSKIYNRCKKYIQSLEPSGVGGSNLEESLIIQLRNLDIKKLH